ncbi:hypothetical protein SAMN05443635_102470 [Roseobacter denitrificans OCh 114]|nr:hypothetical protein SAMN05443635_102470 [Roseobacter denitrificans OCh 114]
MGYRGVLIMVPERNRLKRHAINLSHATLPEIKGFNALRDVSDISSEALDARIGFPFARQKIAHFLRCGLGGDAQFLEQNIRRRGGPEVMHADEA